MAETMPAQIARAGEALAAALKSGRKALACGNGGSAADSASISRRSWWAASSASARACRRSRSPSDTSALTAIANDYDYDRVFSKQVEALGNAGDVLLAISTSGNSKNVDRGDEGRAGAQGSSSSRSPGATAAPWGSMCGPRDFHLNVAHPRTMRVQEVHLLVDPLPVRGRRQRDLRREEMNRKCIVTRRRWRSSAAAAAGLRARWSSPAPARAAVMVSDRRTTGTYVEDENIEWKVVARMRDSVRRRARERHQLQPPRAAHGRGAQRGRRRSDIEERVRGIENVKRRRERAAGRRRLVAWPRAATTRSSPPT